MIHWTLKKLTDGYTFQINPTFTRGTSEFGNHVVVIDTEGTIPRNIWSQTDIDNVGKYLALFPDTDNPFPFGFDTVYSVNYPIVIGQASIDPTISNLPQQSTQSGTVNSISDLPAGTPIGNDIVIVPGTGTTSVVVPASNTKDSSLFIYAVLLVLVLIFVQRG